MKKIIYVDMDDVLCDFNGSHAKALQQNPGGMNYSQNRKLKTNNNSNFTVQIIQTFFKKQTTKYLLNKPLSEVKYHIETELKRGIFNYKQNISGSFIDAYNFKANPIFGPLISNFESSNFYLNGHLQKIADTKTLVKIQIRINTVYGILFFFMLGIGIVSLIVGFISFRKGLFIGLERIGLSSFFLIAALILYLFSIYLHTRARKIFEKIVNPLHDYPISEAK